MNNVGCQRQVKVINRRTIHNTNSSLFTARLKVPVVVTAVVVVMVVGMDVAISKEEFWLI
jgi:hypothetical protein